MRLGMFMMPVHPPGRSLSDTLAEDTTKSILADKLGYDELWMGEHFSATTEPFPSPLMFLAGLVPQTKNLTFGTAVINLPNHHPAIVAGEAAQFDHMSGGRFLFGVGSGGLASDFELFKIDPADAPARLHGIDRHDPAHLGAGSALRHPGRILERADQEGDPAGARRRLHAEAAAEAASADPHLDRQPRLASAKLAGAKGWGVISGPVAPLYAVANHWQAYSEARRQPASPRGAKTGGCRASSSWRRPTPKPKSASTASAPRTATTAPTCGPRWRPRSGST